MFQPTRRIRDRVVLAPTSVNRRPDTPIGRSCDGWYNPCKVSCEMFFSFVRAIRSSSKNERLAENLSSFFSLPRWRVT
ncbi:putative hemerythrin-like protein [Fusarium oxysporum f. sp. albedinis]|nr:putative hemerythrin-like protein [Fusarium oxysporum f. sp. albedinis]